MERRVAIVVLVTCLLAVPAFGATDFGNTEPVPPENLHVTFTKEIFGYNTSELNMSEVSPYIRTDEGNVSIWFTGAKLVPPTARGKIRGPANETVTVYVPFPEAAAEHVELEDVYLYVDGEKRKIRTAEPEGTKFETWAYTTVTTTGTNTTWKVTRPVFTEPTEEAPEANGTAIESESEPADVELDDDVDVNETAVEIRTAADAAGNLTVRVLGNTTRNATMAVTNTRNVSRVLYIPEQVVERLVPRATENLTNVGIFVDGGQEPFSLTRVNGTDWVVFEIDHFSTRHVEFMVMPAASAPGPTVFGIPVSLVVIPGVFVLLAAIAWYLGTRRQRTHETEYVR